MKYVIVSGGVLSGLGKGVTASSIGVLLKSAGMKVTSIKIDPYLNSDAGTMSPFEHGEVFVLDDGGEVDLDLGNYERFLDLNLGKDNNLTTGKIYAKVIEAERKGDYLGKTVQVVPHVTDEIQNWIERVAKIPADGSSQTPDVCVIELGGTVGDIESAPYIEALRQFQFRVGRENVTFVHVSLVPVMGPVGEQKTKPTQHSVKELRGLGIIPDILVCRSTQPMTEETKQKLSAFCHVSADAVMSTHDVPNIYHVPLMLEEQGLCKILGVDCNATNLLAEWKEMAYGLDLLEEEVTIAMVGKYTDLSDAYLSVIKSLQHAAMKVERKLTINWIEASHLENEWKTNSNEEWVSAWNLLESSDGVLVPGGFGDRGIEGKILAVKHARENNVPFLGICLGLQVAAIEFCRNVLGMEDANSTEFDNNPSTAAVIFMPEISKTHLGGTMRLGSRPTIWQTSTSKIRKLYGEGKSVDERHRHRYEINPDLVDAIENSGLIFVGKDETGQRCEIFKLNTPPYFVGVQYHPDFKSRPGKPAPPFLGLLMAASNIDF